MRWLRYVVVGFAFLPLTSCSESPQPAHQSAKETGQVPQPKSRDPHVDSHQAAKHVGESATVATDEVSHASAHWHAATEHATKRSHRRRHGQHRGNHAKANGSQRSGQHTKAITVGDKVPDFEVKLDGRTWTLSELRQNKAITPDGTLVLTFWCSFCGSCRHVERDLDELAKQYHGRAGVIALDASFGETRQAVAAFAKENGLTMPIALNANGSAADVFGINATTTTAVIDSTGVLRYLGQFGDRRNAFARDALQAVLAGKEIEIKSTRPKG